MKHHGPSFSADELDAAGKAIQRKAAEWLARREAQGLSLSQQADLADWLAADPRHAQIFAEVEHAWRRFDALAAYPHSDDVAPNPDLLAPPRVRRRRAVWLPVTLAAAAALVFGGLQIRDHVRTSGEATPDAIATTESRFLRLPDGSMVELNGGAVVTEHFTPAQRRLRLVNGEAHFSVTKDPNREFIVEANGVAVRALGTAFNVRLQEKGVEVLVTEGTVRVAPPAAKTPAAAVLARADEPGPSSATLIAGQRTIVSQAGGASAAAPLVETLQPAEIERALAWQTHRLNFDAIPLSEVVHRLNRFSARAPGAPRLTIADAALGELLISGRVRNDDIESFVEALEFSFGVVAERGAAGDIVLRRAPR